MALDFQSTSAIVFLIVMAGLLYIKRDKVKVQGLFPFFYVILMKTKLGLVQMDVWAKKWRGFWKVLGYMGIVVGFLGMILICVSLAMNFSDLFTKPDAAAGVGVVLPIEAQGVFYVPFWYWIISIFIIAVIHEFAHGLIARVHDMKVKSSGFAFASLLVPIIPAAFVEPDEKQLQKRKMREQLSVFAAGPFSNVLLALVLVAFSFGVINPVVDNMVVYEGITINGFLDAEQPYPAEAAGIAVGELVREVDGVAIETVDDFIDTLQDKGPGDRVDLVTNESAYNIPLAANPTDESKGYLGVTVAQEKSLQPWVENTFGPYFPHILDWFIGLVGWLILLNLGIGLFNLVPIGPLDGGRMTLLVFTHWFGKKKGQQLWGAVSLVFLLIVLAIILKACVFG